MMISLLKKTIVPISVLVLIVPLSARADIEPLPVPTITKACYVGPIFLEVEKDNIGKGAMLNWQDSNDNQSTYTISRQTETTGFKELVSGINGDIRDYNDANLVFGQTYVYKISKQNGYSNTATLTLSYENSEKLNDSLRLKGRANGGRTAVLSWITNQDFSDWKFKLERRSSSSDFSEIKSDISSNTGSYTDIKLDPGTGYIYRLTGYLDDKRVVSNDLQIITWNMGDVNGDGKIDDHDFTIISNTSISNRNHDGWGITWSEGNLSSDNDYVDGNDLALANNAYNKCIHNSVPTISAVPADISTIEGNSFNIKSGVRADDQEDGDITSGISVNGVVDTNIPGDYTLVYFVSDTAGATASVARTIRVKPDPNKIIPNKTVIVNVSTSTQIKTENKALVAAAIVSVKTPPITVVPSCMDYYQSHIVFGKKNDRNIVTHLQSYLNKKMRANIPLTGYYGPQTRDTLKSFLMRNHSDEVSACEGLDLY